MEFAKEHGGFGRGVFRQIMARDFPVAAFGIEDANIGMVDLAESLLARIGLVNGYHENNPGGRHGEFAKIDVNDLIIPVTFTRSVIALMGNRTRGIDGVVIVLQL